MAVREKCIAEKEYLLFDVQRRTDSDGVPLGRTWSDPVHYEKGTVNRDYYPAYFAKIDPMMAAPREMHYWTRLATYPKHSCR